MWSLVYTSDAIKSLTGLDRTIAKRIRAKMLAVAQNPFAPNNNIKKLTGVEGYRLRVGDWQIVSTLERQILTVIVVRVGHRSEVYK